MLILSGDDYMDINDNKYGNNVLLTSEAGMGTMQAGVIGGKRDNDLEGMELWIRRKSCVYE